jgi:hypothetical protein
MNKKFVYQVGINKKVSHFLSFFGSILLYQAALQHFKY